MMLEQETVKAKPTLQSMVGGQLDCVPRTFGTAALFFI